MRYVLIGTTKQSVRTMRKGTLQQLRQYGETLRHYAIYKNVSGFHSTTQEQYLVEYRDDPYWINRREIVS